MSSPSSTVDTSAEANKNAPIKYVKPLPPRKIIFGLLGAALFAGVLYLFATGNLQWDKVWLWLFDYRILQGVLNTLIYSFAAMILGIAGGALLAIASISTNRVWRYLAQGYIALFRALPLIILLLILYNIAIFIPRVDLPGMSINVNSIVTPFAAAVLGLALHEAAYMAEIIRAGINGVNKGQLQATESIGMTYTQSLRWVIVPQALRLIVPPTANQFISMLKNTSLVVVIAGNDLLTVAKGLYSNNFLTMELLFVTAIWYLALVMIFTWVASLLERRFSKGA